MSVLKNKKHLSNINLSYIKTSPDLEELKSCVLPFNEVYEVELDEMNSYVQNKKNQRWLWLDLDHNANKIIAFVFGKRRSFF